MGEPLNDLDIAVCTASELCGKILDIPSNQSWFRRQALARVRELRPDLRVLVTESMFSIKEKHGNVVSWGLIC